jgi:uncharacterized protein YjbI with pentapeptide repeats
MRNYSLEIQIRQISKLGENVGDYLDLRFAYLRGADLRGADLSGADLSGAYLGTVR